MQWRPRSDRDNIVNQTAGQRRATIELERIRRDQARESDRDEILPPPSHMPQASPRHSIIGVPSEVFFSVLLHSTSRFFCEITGFFIPSGDYILVTGGAQYLRKFPSRPAIISTTASLNF